MATDSYGRQFLRYDDMVPLREVRGHVHDMALYAGQSVGLVRDTSSGGDIVRRLAEQAATALASATGA